MDSHKVLVLNQSFEPLNICSARRAVVLLIAGKAERVEDSPRIIYSPSVALIIPSVIRLHRYIHWPGAHIVAFTKKNILKRDGFMCQYCGRNGEERMTIDHVIPRSLGGKTIWENVVSACLPCNLKKGNKTLTEAGMRLLRKPTRPISIFYLSILAHSSHFSLAWSKYIPRGMGLSPPSGSISH
ncbi:MAG: HNH endonuclease [candidate division NC10 bacterium]|nr:HNH endonuclease [candidate division NC10 bacterium]